MKGIYSCDVWHRWSPKDVGLPMNSWRENMHLERPNFWRESLAIRSPKELTMFGDVWTALSKLQSCMHAVYAAVLL